MRSPGHGLGLSIAVYLATGTDWMWHLPWPHPLVLLHFRDREMVHGGEEVGAGAWKPSQKLRGGQAGRELTEILRTKGENNSPHTH